MDVDVEQELLKPASTAPIMVEPIYRSLPVFIGGPHHGESVPVSLMNRSHVQMPVMAPLAAYVEENETPSSFETATYVRGKFAAQWSRRVLDVWYHDKLGEDERSALTWLVVLERADLA